jgi:hypothetical protein
MIELILANKRIRSIFPSAPDSRLLYIIRLYQELSRLSICYEVTASEPRSRQIVHPEWHICKSRWRKRTKSFGNTVKMGDYGPDPQIQQFSDRLVMRNVLCSSMEYQDSTSMKASRWRISITGEGPEPRRTARVMVLHGEKSFFKVLVHNVIWPADDILMKGMHSQDHHFKQKRNFSDSFWKEHFQKLLDWIAAILSPKVLSFSIPQRHIV